MQSNPNGRHCTVCSSPARPLVDGAILSGETVVDIVRDIGVGAGLSKSALYRHRRAGHVAGRLSVPLAGEGVADVVTTLVNGISQAQALYEVATRRGADAAALRALAEVRAGSAALADRLGIDDLAVASNLADHARLVRALRKATVLDLTVADTLATAADRLGFSDLADDARALGAGARAHLKSKNEN